ncbi:MAG: LamG domain-containing protein, partial [Planctomycetota bacterium]
MRRQLNKQMCAFLVLVLAVLSPVLNAQDPSLVLYFSFDDDVAGEAQDHSVYANNGALEGDPAPVEGKFGGAFMFDAGDDQIVVPSNETLDIQDQITMMAWINPGANLTADWRTIVGKSPTNVLGNTTFSYDFRSDNSGVLRFSLNIGGWQFILGPTLVQDTWYHIAGTYDGQEMILYLDGEPIGTAAASGQINVTPDPVCVGNIVNAAGATQNEYWSGIIDEVRIWDRALSDEEVKINMELGREQLVGSMPLAIRPEPADGAMHEDTWVNLRWIPGELAVSHDVYIGDNFDDVNDRLGDTFQGNQTGVFVVAGFPGFAFPDGLVPGTTYYWRIDEVNDADPNSPWKGNVWSFWVPPKKAWEPDPADGAGFLDADVTFNWTAGFGTKLHHVYFGDNRDEVSNAAGALPQADATFTAGTLELDKTYYWRVDEFDGVTTHKGDVWAFTTMPVIAVSNEGTNALDWSGHDNHGTLVGPRWTVPGRLGDGALDLAGGYVAIRNLSYDDPNDTAVTVCAWVRTSSSATQYIVSFDRDNYWRLEINGTGAGPGQVGWDVMTSSGQVDYGSVTRVDDGAWHHLCGVFDNGRSTIYIDGIAEPSATGGPTFGSGNTRFGFIGANSEATSFDGSRGGGSPVSGEIDDIRIYNTALTQDQIILVMRGDPLLAWNPSPTDGSIPDI